MHSWILKVFKRNRRKSLIILSWNCINNKKLKVKACFLLVMFQGQYRTPIMDNYVNSLRRKYGVSNSFEKPYVVPNKSRKSSAKIHLETPLRHPVVAPVFRPKVATKFKVNLGILEHQDTPAFKETMSDNLSFKASVSDRTYPIQ